MKAQKLGTEAAETLLMARTQVKVFKHQGELKYHCKQEVILCLKVMLGNRQ